MRLPVYCWLSLALLSVGTPMAWVFFGTTKPLPVIPRPADEINVLRVAVGQNLVPDPHRRGYPFPAHSYFILSLWEPLIECDPATGVPQPAAAQSWSWSPDRLVLTVKLRPDARWSDDSPVTAHDFVRAWRRLLRLGINGAQTLFPLKHAEDYHRGIVDDPEKLGIRAVDDLTLRLELRQIRSTWLAELADPLLSPLHAGTERVLAAGSYADDPSVLVTNGPFQLQQSGDRGFRLRASPTYHGRADVRLAGVNFVRIVGYGWASLLLSAGNIDLISPWSLGDSWTPPTDRPFKSESEIMMSVNGIVLNVKRGPLRDIRVRQALALALDRQSAIRQHDPGRYVPAWSLVPNMPGREGLTLLKENVEEARRLLTEAGYPNGQGFPILEMALPLRARSDPYPATWAEQWYQQLGVRTHLAYEPLPVHNPRLKAGGFDVYYTTLIATVQDASDLLSLFRGPPAFSATEWRDKEVDQLLYQGDLLTGPARMEALAKAERLVMAAVAVVPVLFDCRQTMMAAEVQGWYAEPLGRQSFKRLWLVPAATPLQELAL